MSSRFRRNVSLCTVLICTFGFWWWISLSWQYVCYFWQHVFPFLEVELIQWVDLQKQYVKTQSHTFFFYTICLIYNIVAIKYFYKYLFPTENHWYCNLHCNLIQYSKLSNTDHFNVIINTGAKWHSELHIGILDYFLYDFALYR